MKLPLKLGRFRFIIPLPHTQTCARYVDPRGDQGDFRKILSRGDYSNFR